MAQDEIDLIVRDLSARVPYNVKIRVDGRPKILRGVSKQKNRKKFGEKPVEEDYVIVYDREDGEEYCGFYGISDWNVKPYLRPLETITDEEERQINESLEEVYNFTFKTEELLENIKEQKTFPSSTIDLMNKFNLDWRGLIPLGLAKVAPVGMYK